MAGSYIHATTDDGKLRKPEDFNQMVENLGDAYETVEEMYGMIWWLAATITSTPDIPTLAEGTTPKQWVEMARKKYQTGLRLSPGIAD